MLDQTKKLVLDFFTALADGERKTEEARIALNSCEDFDPYLLFNRLDQYRNNCLTEDNLIDFATLHKIDVTINQGKFLILFYDTDSDRSLNYNEFLNLVLCKDFYQMRQNVSGKYNDGNASSYISYETEAKFCQVLQSEFLLIQTIDGLLADIKSYGDFSVSELITQLGVKGNSITASAFENYFNQNKVNVSKEDISGLMKRLDLRRNGRIDMSNLERVFYFPYSSPPSKAVSQSPSIAGGLAGSTETVNLNPSRKNSQFSGSFKANEEQDIIYNQDNDYQPKTTYGYKGKKNLYSINTDNNLESTNDQTMYRQSNVKFGRNNNNNINTFASTNSLYNAKNNYSINTDYPLKSNYTNQSCYQYQSTQPQQTDQYRPNYRNQRAYEPLSSSNQNNFSSSQYNYTSKIYNTTAQNDMSSPMRISKTLALRKSPVRKMSPQMMGASTSSQYNYQSIQKQNIPEPVFTEQNFVSFITALMNTEKELEAKKIQLLCSQPDFNVEDVFVVFETQNTKNDILSFDDLKQGFAKLNLRIDEHDLELLVQRYDLVEEGGISYSNLFDMLVPFDKENRDNVEHRESQGALSNNTINVLKDFFGLLISSEQKIEMLRQRISSMKGIDIKKIYTEQIDQYGYGFNSDEELEGYLKRKGIQYQQRDADLLFIRLDRNRAGKISLDDI